MSRKLNNVIFAMLMALSACGGMEEPGEELVATPDELASAKATARVGDIAILDRAQLDWSTVMSTQLKTSAQKTLFIDVSFECGLLTKTLVRSKTGIRDTSMAEAAVLTQVIVDGKVAYPGPVVYCKRTQELSATLGGILESCTDANGDGTIMAAECQFTDEEISLVLGTMTAASFNFVQDVGTGVHTIAVQAKIGTTTSVQAGEAEAKGSIGKGSVVVTEQRLIKNDPVTF